MWAFWLLVCLTWVHKSVSISDKYDEEHYAVIYPSKCEACKYTIEEFELFLKETGKTSRVIETGYGLESKKKRTKYVDSQLRFEEILIDLCERMKKYRVHKERKDSTRFAKYMSQTFEALHGLVDKGVKVDLGMPQELWDEPSAEISDLQKQCDAIIGEHEDRLLDWYNDKRTEGKSPLKKYFCEDHYLKSEDKSCLYEVFDPVKSVKTDAEQKKEKAEALKRKKAAEKKKKKKAKGDKGNAPKVEL